MIGMTPFVLALIALLPLATGAMAQEPESILLWPNGTPGSEGKLGDEVNTTYQWRWP